ncbi:hypothetical protein ABBQ38_004272 [Trebouxia sp. C0009 RCD-2024]
MRHNLCLVYVYERFEGLHQSVTDARPGGLGFCGRVPRNMSGIVPRSSLCPTSTITKKRCVSPRSNVSRSLLCLQFRSVGRRITLNCAAQVPDDPQPSNLVVGIDLGTTNSAVARFIGRRPKIIKQEGEASTVPSVVAYLPDGKVLVGKAAQRQAGAQPLNTFYSVKRFIGRQLDDLPRGAVQQVPYIVEEADQGEVVLRCANAEGGQLYPEEVSGQVLAHLLAHAEQSTGSTISKAVISVPAYFDEEQKHATITAGQIAGLQTVRLLREPVAAALAYGINLKKDQTVLVLDLGGGTYDVSILEVGQGVVEVLATGGDPQLGGDDFDNVIVDWLIKEHLKPQGVKWRQPEVISQLRTIAEAAKIRLSDTASVAIKMPLKGRDSQPIQAVLTLQKFEQLSADLFRRARLPLDEACWQAGVDLGSVRADLEAERKRRGKGKKQAAPQAQLRPKRRPPISQVLLVGGSTRMPAFRRFVHNMTGLEPATFVQPDEAVALGAAVQAGILEGQVSDVMVLNVWQASLMRAFAKQRLRQDDELAGSAGLDPEQLEDSSDDEDMEGGASSDDGET